MNDATLHRLLQLAARPGLRRGWRCPGAHRLAAYVEGRAPAEARQRLEAHLADCSFCLGQVGFLARAAESERLPVVASDLLVAARAGRDRTGWAPRPLAASLAGAAALALALLVLPPRGPVERPFADSGPTVGHQVRGLPAVDANAAGAAGPLLTQPVEGEIVPSSRLALAWQEVPGALFYTAQVMSERGDVIWEGRTERARLVVPGSDRLVPGRTLFVWIVAHYGSGAIERSPVVSFRLAPR